MSKFFTKKIIFSFLVAALVFLPALSFADVSAPPPASGSITSIVGLINGLLDLVWKAFFAVAVIMLVVAGIEFLTARGEPGEIKKAKAFLIWGIVGIIVATSAFSIVKVITGLLVPPDPNVCIAGVTPCNCDTCVENCGLDQCQ